MKYTIITYTITILIYVLFPTAQQLRPTSFERSNALTRFMAFFYLFDTNTNVCPSLHVVGALAVFAAAWNSKHFSTKLWRLAFAVVTAFISVSTVFLKQHSVIDVFAAIAVCTLAYPIIYRRKPKNV